MAAIRIESWPPGDDATAPEEEAETRFEEMYVAYWPLVATTALKLIHDPDEAEHGWYIIYSIIRPTLRNSTYRMP